MSRPLVLTAALRLLGSEVFQPAQFPDLGPSVYEAPASQGRQQNMIVESNQSMANHLEAAGWDPATNDQPDLLAPLPYARIVTGDDEFITTSRLEAHRLNAAAVCDALYEGAPVRELYVRRLGLRRDRPLDYQHIARAIAQLDPFSLLHGVYFAHKSLFGQPKITRAITAEITAHDVRPVPTGGVKRERVLLTLVSETNKASKIASTTEGYGHVPYGTMRWTAERFVATFVLDRALLHSYGLPASVTTLLETLALWEIRSLLDNGLRLRSACHLVVDYDLPDTRLDDLPAMGELTSALATLVPQAARELDWQGPWSALWPRA